MKTNDLPTPPKGFEVPVRPNGRHGKRSIGNTILVSKGDFEYIEDRGFKGRFTIFNRWNNGIITSRRLAVALENDKTIVLAIVQENRTTQSPDGATWRTVRLVSAYKTEDGKLCVIEISPDARRNEGETK